MLQKKTVESAAPSDKETVSLGIDVRVTLFGIFLHLFMFCQYFCTIFPCVAFAPRHQTGQWP